YLRARSYLAFCCNILLSHYSTYLLLFLFRSQDKPFTQQEPTMTVNVSILITFVGYLALTMLIGVIAYQATRSLSDYILGGRRLGPAVAALSVGASDMSGWLLLGLPGAVYLYGMSQAWIGIGLVIGAWLNWLFVARRLRVYTEQ